MKEDNKKKKTTTAKKTSSVKKASTASKTTAKKTTTKKAPVAAKKTTTAKKATQKKETVKKVAPKKVTKVAPKKTVVKKVEEKKIEQKKVEETNIQKNEKYDNQLIARGVLIVACSLIIVFLIIGFIDSSVKQINIGNSNTQSYIIKKNVIDKSHVLELNNAKESLSKLNGNYFVYISYTTSSSIDLFERDLKKVIDKYDLKDKFYYIDVTNIIKKNDYLKEINNSLGYLDTLVTQVPTIVYVNSENIITRDSIIARSDNKLIQIGDFQKLLDINEFKEKK